VQARNDPGAQPAAWVSRHVEADGLRLHYLDYGTADKPVMMCVHGGGAHAHWFDFVASGFTADYHVCALDQRGHGDSQWAEPPSYAYERYAADLAEVVERLDLRNFVLVGHSMGGMVSLLYAANHPGRVGKLVIVDTTFRMSEEKIAALRDVGARQGRTYKSHEDFVASYRLRPEGTTATSDVLRHLASNGAGLHMDGSWRHKFDRRVYARRESLNSLPWWNHIKVPALLVKGGLSQRITPEIFAAVRTLCPQVEFAEVSNSEHHVTLDNPGEFVQKVRSFLAAHP